MFRIVDLIITSIEKDKWLQLSLVLIFIWMIFILIWLKTQANAYTTPILQHTHQVWWYTWWPRANKLYHNLRKVWYNDYHSKLIINKCKRFTQDVNNCVIAIASIGKAESNAFKHCYHNNCLWLAGWRYWYKSVSDSLNHWISKYNKYWYNWKWKGGARFFYSLNWRPSLSRYCTSEVSSWMKKFSCPNGYRNFKAAFRLLNK